MTNPIQSGSSHPVGFILLTHAKPLQIRRLIKSLDRLFDRPPIVCHHDISKCELSIADYGDNVQFVRSPVCTRWGDFSLVEATLRGIRQMYDAPSPPEWFVLLSAADYPIKPAGRIVRELMEGGYDAHIHHELVTTEGRDWQRLCHWRYMFHYPSLTRRFRFIQPIWWTLTLRGILCRPFLPFSSKFRCFAGSQFFCANRRAAEHILEFQSREPALAAHYRSVDNPEESYFQCVLANAAHLKVHNCDYRYCDWTAGGAHPKTLALDDLQKLLASSAHFARKFDKDRDSAILDALDVVVCMA